MDDVPPEVVSAWNGSEFTGETCRFNKIWPFFGKDLPQCQVINVAGWPLNVSGTWVIRSYRFLHGGMVAGLEYSRQYMEGLKGTEILGSLLWITLV